jgi:hypothetical protein
MASEIEILRDWLIRADFQAIVDFAGGHKRVLSYLTALTYDLDRTLSWRAVEALGLAATRIAEDNPEYVRVHLRRLTWLLNDESGGIGWRAPEAIGEIIRGQPDLFKSFVPILVNLMDTVPEDAIRFRVGWLWAIGRLAEVRNQDARAALPWILPCLDDPDPQVRGMAAWCLGQMRYRIPPEMLQPLQSDEEKVELYVSPDRQFVDIRELLSKLATQD